MRDKREATLRPSLDAIGQEIHQIGQQLEAIPSDQAPIRAAINHSRLALNKLAPDIAEADEELQSLARVLEQELETASQRLDLLKHKGHLREEITDAVSYTGADKPGAIGLFSSRLQDYLKAYPDEPCSQAFQKILKERPLWETVEAWNGFATRWTTHRNGLPPQEAELRARSCGQFLIQHPDFPGIADLARYQRHVQAVARRARGADKLQRVFSNPLVNHVWMVVLKAENNPRNAARYYALEQPLEKNGLLQFNGMTDFSGGIEFHSINATRIASKDLSPQSQLANQANSILTNESRLTRWETVMIDLINAILRQSHIDPIFQLALLTQVTATAVEGSEALRVSLEAMKSQLDQGRVNVNFTWMKPETLRLAEVQEEAPTPPGGPRQGPLRRGRPPRARPDRAKRVEDIPDGGLARTRP